VPLFKDFQALENAYVKVHCFHGLFKPVRTQGIISNRYWIFPDEPCT
jgi:hypothetical protein